MKKFQKSKYVLDEIDMIYKKKKNVSRVLSFKNFERFHELSDLNLKILSQLIYNIYFYEKLPNDGNRTISIYLEATAFPRDLAISFLFFFFFFTQSIFFRPFTIDSFSGLHHNKFNFRSVFFLTSLYTQKSLKIPIAIEIAKIGKEMYHVCHVILIPEDFRGPSFLFFFFSLFRFSFRLLFLSSRHISMFCRMEFDSMREEEGKKQAKSDVSRKILCFWLVELDEITRNHGSPTSFGTVRIVRI